MDSSGAIAAANIVVAVVTAGYTTGTAAGNDQQTTTSMTTLSSGQTNPHPYRYAPRTSLCLSNPPERLRDGNSSQKEEEYEGPSEQHYAGLATKAEIREP